MDDESLLSGFDGDEGDETPQHKESDIVRMRKELERREKELKRLSKANEELSAFKETVVREQTTSKVQTVFTEIGLNPKMSGLFLASHDVGSEVTPEAVKTWASEYGLVSAESTPEPEPAQPVAEAPVFTPTTVGVPPAGPKIYSRAEFLDIYNRDPNAAAEIKRRGLVDTSVADFPRPLGS